MSELTVSRITHNAGPATPVDFAATPTVNGVPIAGSVAAITSGSINGTIIGNITPDQGLFTQLSASGNLTVLGNTTLGDAAVDTLAINATSTFSAPVSFTQAATFTGGLILGDAAGDIVTVNGTATFAQNATFSSDIAVNGGDITTSATTASIFNSNATTLNLGQAATNMQVGSLAATSIQVAGQQVVGRLGSAGAISGDRNRVINGSCQVVNVPTFVAVTGNTIGFGGPELFQAATSSGAAGQFTQSQGSLTFGGLTLNTVRQTVDTPIATTTGSARWQGIYTRLEGYNVFDLKGKPVSLSFVFNTNVSGTYSVAVNDGISGTSSYVATFTATANTPTQVSLSIPTVPLGADIPNSSAFGLVIAVGFLNTGTFQTNTLNTWLSGQFLSAQGATNWGATAGNFIELTNLQLEEGSIATPFVRRNFAQELALTQRYFEIGPSSLKAFFQTANAFKYVWNYAVRKRATPTVTFTTLSVVAQNMPATFTSGINSPLGALTNTVFAIRQETNQIMVDGISTNAASSTGDVYLLSALISEPFFTLNARL